MQHICIFHISHYNMQSMIVNHSTCTAKPTQFLLVISIQIHLCILGYMQTESSWSVSKAAQSGPSCSNRVHTFRIDQSSLTFPWRKFKFPWQYQSRKFDKFSKKTYIRTKHSSFIRLKCKIPWHFLDIFAKFHFSLTHHRIPWQFPDLEKKKFPWHFQHVWTLSKHC